MRKTTAYGRKLARSGQRNEMGVAQLALSSARIMKTISVRRDREAPPMPGGECWADVAMETARDSELKVRAALDSLLGGRLPATADLAELDMATLNAALAIGAERTLQILYGRHQPGDDATLDESALNDDARAAIRVFVQGRQALNRAYERWRQRGQWGLDGPGRGELTDAVNLFAELMTSSTPAQMDAAYREADRVIRRLYGKGLI